MNKLHFPNTFRFTAQKTQITRSQLRTRLTVFPLLFLFICGCLLPLVIKADTLPSISGVVLSEATGQPIANALVRVSSPAIDMRSVRDRRVGLYDAHTDTKGRFTLRVPQNPKISLNAFAPGYEEAAGLWMSGNWTFNGVPFPTNPKQQFILKLRPALYVAGVVVDESGHPLTGAAVEATLGGERSTCYVAFDNTDAKGRFAIFDFPLKPDNMCWETNARGQLTFRSPTKLTSIIQNVYTLSEKERNNLRVTLNSGHDIKGVITSATGQPLAQIIAEAVPFDSQAARRLSLIDAQGRFSFPGLPDGEVKLCVHSWTFDQQARKSVQLSGANAEANLRLEPVILKNPPKQFNLLGMKLANVTPELQAVYDLDSPTGVIILDPGADFLRLGIGDLSPGERFWIVGEKEIKNQREMVAELLRIDAIAPPGDPNEGCHGSVRVVYAYRSGAGTNTQRLKLTDEDIAALKSILLTAAN